jgi:hypothetical protein
MSKIYPTPPTPAQQFSPQNVLMFSHHYLPHQFHPSAQPPIHTEQAIVSVLSFFSDQLQNLPWDEPIYESANCHKAHTRHFCKNILSIRDINREDRLNDINCFECASILNSIENQVIWIEIFFITLNIFRINIIVLISERVVKIAE